MSAAVSVSSLQKLVDAGQITPQDIAAKVKSGEIELHDDRAAALPKRRPVDELPADAPEKTDFGAYTSTAAIGRGALKGAQETGTSLMKIIKGAATGDFGPFDDPKIEPEIAHGNETHGFAEGAGKFAERTAEFMAGEGAANAIAKGTGLVARIVKGAAVGAGVTAAQGGDAKEVATNAVVGGGLAPVLEATGAGAKWLGQKMQANHIRGGLADEAAGFSIDTLNKYGLAGMTLKGTLEKVHGKITELASNLRDITKNAPGAIDLGDVLAKTESELLSRAGKIANHGDTAGIKNAIDKFVDEAGDLGGNVTIDEAQTLKRTVGLKGAWQFGRADSDTAKEAVANTYQKYLKQAIENATPNGEVAAINKQLGELMPIEKAITRRLPVEVRSAPLSIKDLALIVTGHPALAGVHMIANTMGGATATHAAGGFIQKAARAATSAAEAAVKTGFGN